MAKRYFDPALVHSGKSLKKVETVSEPVVDAETQIKHRSKAKTSQL
jgi:hypothetical protein